MGLFSRGRGAGRAGAVGVVPPGELARLGQVGRAVYADGGFVDVSGFYMGSFQRLGLPTGEFADRLVADLLVGAEAAADDWAYPGALHVAIDFDGPDVAGRPGGDVLVDRALRVLAREGIGSVQIPTFLLTRWHDIHTAPA